MSMPFQIWCDYLEDRGVDTRLLRSVPVEMELCYNRYSGGYTTIRDADCQGDGDGYGFGAGDGGTFSQGYTPLFDVQAYLEG